MIFDILQIISLFLVASTLAALLVNKKIIYWMVIILFSFFINFEISSLIFGGSLIDYKYYAHLQTENLFLSQNFFLKESIGLVCSFFALVSFIFFGSKIIHKVYTKYKKWIWVILLGLIAFLGIKDSIFNKIFLIGKLHFASQTQLEESLSALKYKQYISKSQTKSISGKNIVVIVLESVESMFLNDQFKHLTPNLRKLKEDWNYYKLKQAEGSDFTLSAVYTYLTGLPCFFKNHGNDVFSHTASINTNNIGHVLNEAGYDLRYMLGNPDFGGMGNLFSLMEFDVKSEKNYDQKYTTYPWGLHDKDLFDLAIKELDSLNAQAAPFALFLSTISTHHPNGILDKRIEDVVGKQRSDMELMIAGVDNHIQRLIDHLSSIGALENTAVFILPDHLLMGNTSPVYEYFEGDRDLFLISNNAPSSIENKSSIIQLDIAKSILEGAEIKHNLNFLTDAIDGDKIKFIEKNKTTLLQLNESLVARFPPGLKEKRKSLLENKETIFIESCSTQEKNKDSFFKLGQEEVIPKKGMHLFHFDQNQNKFISYHFKTHSKKSAIESLLDKIKNLQSRGDYFLLAASQTLGEKIHEYNKTFEALGFSKLAKLPNNHAYIAISDHGYTTENAKKTSLIFNAKNERRKPYRKLDQISNVENNRRNMIAHAGGAIDGESYTNSLEAMNNAYKDGFRMFEIDIVKTADNHFVAAHDWNSWKDKTQYKGKLPPTKSDFLNHKILGKYTPMDMELINDWFTKNEDAVLVTDKVNEPKAFLNTFDHNARLMMELFSVEAAREAHQLGIEIMLSENVCNDLASKFDSTIKELDISNFAFSIRTIDGDRMRFRRYLDRGLKVYAFHINHDKFKDEQYMFREGLDYCHGFYADKIE